MQTGDNINLNLQNRCFCHIQNHRKKTEKYLPSKERAGCKKQKPPAKYDLQGYKYAFAKFTAVHRGKA